MAGGGGVAVAHACNGLRQVSIKTAPFILPFANRVLTGHAGQMWSDISERPYNVSAV